MASGTTTQNSPATDDEATDKQRLLVVGGAGYVGTILRPVLADRFDYCCFDRKAIPEIGDRCIVADVDDDEAVKAAVADVDTIVYLAMGVKFTDRQEVGDIDLAFDVNVRGTYRFLKHGFAAGVKRFVYASTLSVYATLRTFESLDEDNIADAWDPYGMSKRLGERLCEAAVQTHPDRIVVALRMMLPRNEMDFHGYEYKPGKRNICALAPNDTRRLFLAAVDCDTPGVHIVQATGDLEDKEFPNRRATELLGWRPEGN